MEVPKSLRTVMALQFLELLGAGLTMPVFLYFALNTLKLSASQSGLILSAFSAAQLLGAPIVGRLSDAYGRRVPLLAVFGWTWFWFWATACVRSFHGLLIVRTMAGLSGGSIAIVQAMALDSSSEEIRPRVFGLLGGVQGLAFTLGPLVATVVYNINPPFERRLMLVFAGALALVACIVGCFTVEETLKPHQRRPLRATSKNGQVWEMEISMRPALDICSVRLCSIWVARFCSAFCFTYFVSTYAFLVRDGFGWGDQRLGMVLVSGGILGAIAQLWSYPSLSQMYGKHTVFVVGACMVSVFFVWVPHVVLVVHSVRIHLMCGLGFVFGISIMEPGIPDLVACHAPAQRTGLVQGITNAVKSTAAVLAPLLAGRAYDANPRASFFLAAGTAAVAGACVATAGLVSARGALLDKLGGGKLGSAKQRMEAGEAQALLQKL